MTFPSACGVDTLQARLLAAFLLPPTLPRPLTCVSWLITTQRTSFAHSRTPNALQSLPTTEPLRRCRHPIALATNSIQAAVDSAAAGSAGGVSLAEALEALAACFAGVDKEKRKEMYAGARHVCSILCCEPYHLVVRVEQGRVMRWPTLNK